MKNILHRPRFLVLLALAAILPLHAGEKNTVLISDSFSLKGNRKAGETLRDADLEKGGGTWKVYGEIAFQEDGGITPGNPGDACMAIAAVPGYKLDAPITLSAELKPGTTGHVSLAFLSSGDPGKFWEAAGIWVFINKGGVGLFSNGSANTLFTGNAQSIGFTPGKYMKVELRYDPREAVVSLEIDGKSIVTDVPVKTPPERITHAAIRFNEPVEPGLASARDFAVTLN